ncbi:hypothetical protein MA16_Dca011205 [Dendrobium catenatum]|uniref:Uncharacterized protein n=1 Tax=Dendrobium catenatum TaxID=906689 RepID=A0A2I0VW50_9ASPA|nr:hypothetical protein MA16_Dca011205 [Dendrobium catenatum]
MEARKKADITWQKTGVTWRPSGTSASDGTSASLGGPSVVRQHSGVPLWSNGGAVALRRPFVVRRWCGRTTMMVQQYYGDGAAALRCPLVVRRWCGRPTEVVRQHSGGGRGGARRLELSSFSSFFSLGFLPLLFHEEMGFYL